MNVSEICSHCSKKAGEFVWERSNVEVEMSELWQNRSSDNVVYL